MGITADVQTLALGKLMTFYEVDLTDIVGSALVIRVTPCTNPALDEDGKSTGEYEPVIWRTYTYYPFDVRVSGLEVSGKGTMPRPTVQISNINNVLSAYMIAYEDLIGAKFSRYRTFAKYLDGEPEADPTKYMGPDEFIVERKVSQNPVYVEFELSCKMDHEGRMIPARQIIRDYCMHQYRVWTGAAFDYTNATCPYTGTGYYNRRGDATTIDGDACGKKRRDCYLRYGRGAKPTRAFYGVERIDTGSVT